MRNVALVGGFGSGKTTAADLLEKVYGYTRVSLARNLKDVAADAINSGRPIEKTSTYGVTDLYGAERRISGRQVLQELGQSVKALDRNLWVRWLVSDIRSGRYGPGPYVVDDCRFYYEALALSGGVQFLIGRLEVPEEVRAERYYRTYGLRPTAAELSHPSETEMNLIEADFTVNGEMSPVDVATTLARLLQ